MVGDLTDPQNVLDAMTGADRMFFSHERQCGLPAGDGSRGRRGQGVWAAGDDREHVADDRFTDDTDEPRAVSSASLALACRARVELVGIAGRARAADAFLDNPIFTWLAVAPLRERNVLALPFGIGRTSPIAASDVARVVSTVLLDPAARIGDVYELTGPVSLDVARVGREYCRALHRPISGEDIPHDAWVQRSSRRSGCLRMFEQHLATMAHMHRAGRYERATDDVEKLTGHRL